MTRVGEFHIAEAIEGLAKAVNRLAKALGSRATRGEPEWVQRLEGLMTDVHEVVTEIRAATDEHDAELQDVARALGALASRSTINPEDTAELESLTERIRASTAAMKDAVASAEGTAPAEPAPAEPAPEEPAEGSDPATDQPPA